MSSDQSLENDVMNTGSLTIGQILSMLWIDARKIAIITFAVTLVAILYAFLAPEKWKAIIHVVPTEVPQTEQLGALAEVLSKKAGSGSANIDLFNALIISRPVIEKLFVSKISKPGVGVDTLYSIQSLLKIDSSDFGTVFYAADGIGKQIEFSQLQNSLSNIVEISVTAETPWLAKGMLTNLLDIAQSSLFKITRSRYEAVIQRLIKADSIALMQAREASDAYTAFQSENRNSNQPLVFQKSEQLRREQDIKDQTYIMVRRELEQNRLEIDKITPPVVAIDSAFVPPFRESPKRKEIMVAAFLLSLLASSGASLAIRIYSGRKK